MKMLFVDSSAFIAIVNAGDSWHGKALELLGKIEKGDLEFKRIVTSDYVIDETITRLRYSVGYKEAVEWGRNILVSNVVERINVDEEIFNRAWELFEKYDDKMLSFTDCTSFSIMEKMGIRKVFAFDEDFDKVGFETLR